MQRSGVAALISCKVLLLILLHHHLAPAAAGVLERKFINRTSRGHGENALKNHDLGPPDHLDAVKFERDGDANAEFMHEIFLGEDEHHFKHAKTNEEKLKQLKSIFEKADLDNDGRINEDELHLWIMKMVGDHMTQAVKDSQEKFSYILENPRDSYVSYGHFVKVFMESLRKHNASENYRFTPDYVKKRLDTITQEWKNADLNNDDKLTDKEFLFFQHPEMSNLTLAASVKEFLNERDYDQNGKLDEKEFVFGFPVGDIIMDDYLDGDLFIRDSIIQFRKYIDTDTDGFLSYQELTVYMDPFSSINARNDAHQIMFQVDIDMDQELIWNEVLEASDYLTGTKLFDASTYFHIFMSEKNPMTDLADYVAKSGEEKRGIIKSIIFGSHGKTKREVDFDKVYSMVQDAFAKERMNPHFSLILQAMADIGCVVNMDAHVAVKICGEEGSGLLGSFNHERNQIEICQEPFVKAKFDSQRRAMQTTLSHILIEAFDHCRANVDASNPEHDMCMAIRGAALSGMCTSDARHLNKAQVASSKRGYQSCILQRAVETFGHRNPSWDMDQTKDLIRKVFPTCYNDYTPHDRLPYNTEQAELSYKAYLTRNRYNI